MQTILEIIDSLRSEYPEHIYQTPFGLACKGKLLEIRNIISFPLYDEQDCRIWLHKVVCCCGKIRGIAIF